MLEGIQIVLDFFQGINSCRVLKHLRTFFIERSLCSFIDTMGHECVQGG